MSKLYDKILLTTDGSEYSMNALEHALSIAEANDAKIIVLNVIEDTFVMNMPNSQMIKDVKGALTEKSQEVLDKVKELKEDLDYDVELEFKAVEGSPANTIVKVVEEEDIDLIVIGSSGKANINKLIIGSVANKVVNAANCNVLVIK